MRRTCALFTSLFIFLQLTFSQGSDSTRVINTLGFGVELSGPVIYTLDSNNFNLEFSVSYRISQKYYACIEPGAGRFSYSQYNYDYNSHGFFVRAGVDINLLKPKSKPGKHFAGLGLRYGLSLFTQETPSASYSNYWGSYDFAIDPEFVHAHFLEVNGGVKAEIFRNILIGWTARARLLVYQSAGKNNKPLMIPGMGSAGGGLQPGFSYHLIWLIPLKEGR